MHTKESHEFLAACLSRCRRPPPGSQRFNVPPAPLAAAPNGGPLLPPGAELTGYPRRSAAEYLQPAGYRSVTVTATFTSPFARAKPRTITRVLPSQVVIARLARPLDGMHATAPWTGSCPALLPQFQIVFAPKRGGNSRAASVSVSPAACRSELISTDGQTQPNP